LAPPSFLVFHFRARGLEKRLIRPYFTVKPPKRRRRIHERKGENMFRTLFPGDFFSDLDRLQRQLLRFSGATDSIRGFGRGGFPSLNIGTTPESVEIFAFAPGLDPASIELSIERGLLSLSGERRDSLPQEESKPAIHINERFSGAYRRVVSLSDDIDPETARANYKDGVLHIQIKRRAAAVPRRIDIQ
jgi:HSP20 family protein